MKKNKIKIYKIGEILNYGKHPCRECGVPHNEVVIGIKPMRSSWETDGHPYWRISDAEFINLLWDPEWRRVNALERNFFKT